MMRGGWYNLLRGTGPSTPLLRFYPMGTGAQYYCIQKVAARCAVNGWELKANEVIFRSDFARSMRHVSVDISPGEDPLNYYRKGPIHSESAA
jgi:hypothetical protein